MRLKTLLQPLEILASWGDIDISIDKIAYHTKDVQPGTVFVCIKGFQTDGHRYAPAAVKKGAAALVVEDHLPGLDVPQIQVADTRQALASMGDVFYGQPSRDMTLIGITASNGKTSTSFMVDAILEEAGLKTGLIGTVMVKVGDQLIPSVLTTPESLDLHAFLAKMKETNISHVTMEVSSSALDLLRAAGVDFDIVAFNNITREHIDLHGSFENYFNAKARLIREAGSGKWAVLNLDDEHAASLADETDAHVLTYGIERGDGHLWGSDIDVSTGRGKFTVSVLKPFTVNGVTYEETTFEVELSVAGFHSVYNAMAAVSIGMLNGLPVPVIQKGLKQFKGVERRFQIVYEDDFLVIDDHFANAGNIDVTMETLTKMDFQDLHIVYAVRGKRGVTTNRENAETMAEWLPQLGVKEVIATLSEPTVKEKDRVLPEEVEVFRTVMEEHGINVRLFEKLTDALQQSLDQVKEGDAILLAGAQGMDYGANFLLHQLAQRHPEKDQEALFAPLKNRIAGMDKLPE